MFSKVKFDFKIVIYDFDLLIEILNSLVREGYFGVCHEAELVVATST